MPTSTKRSLRYPVLGDSPDVPRDLGYLVADLEAEVGRPSDRQILVPGLLNNLAGGRVLTQQDFADAGLSSGGSQLALWNLSSGASVGSQFDLTNKGSVPFGVGITGNAAEAAVFAGSSAQSLWRNDTGATDPLRIRTGSVGAWFKVAKQATAQTIIAKTMGGAFSWQLAINTSNQLVGRFATTNGLSWTHQPTSLGSVCDDRWHFAVMTYDGDVARLYLDGEHIQMTSGTPGLVFAGTAPVNIGSYGADGGVAGSEHFWGRVDEAFVIPDVADEEQVRMLMAVRVATSMTSPRRAHVQVKRRRKGGILPASGTLASAVRIVNLDGDADFIGSGGSGTLTVNAGGGTISGRLTDTGTPPAGPDGKRAGAFYFAGTHDGLSGSDAALPLGASSAAARKVTYGCWVKTAFTLAQPGFLVGWGTLGSAETALRLQTDGTIRQYAGGSDGLIGPVVCDGDWHHVVSVEDNDAVDGLKRKLYVDGKFVQGTTSLGGLTGGGANAFRIGAAMDGTAELNQGFISRVFVVNAAFTAEQINDVMVTGPESDMIFTPKDSGPHIEGFTALNDALWLPEGLESQDTVRLEFAK